LADAIAFGRPYLFNPDLVEMVEEEQAFGAGDMKTWYMQGVEGYLDYATAEK
jgi:2,4-dienoyl-CoA reductase-like NADH-dependent reductase (Old Yellow Enzyme family)